MQSKHNLQTAGESDIKMSEEQTTLSMKMEEAKDLPLVEEGDYTAEVTKIDSDQVGKFGKMLVIYFDINGVEVSALCSQKLNAKTKLYSWVKTLTGKAPIVGEELELKDLVGKKALVTVRNRAVKDETGNAQIKDGKPVMTSGINELRKA